MRSEDHRWICSGLLFIQIKLPCFVSHCHRQWAKLPAGHAGDGRDYLSGEMGR